MMTKEQLDEIRARCEASTPGAWVVSNATQIHYSDEFDEQTRKDIDFIAHARQDITALICALEESEKDREETNKLFLELSDGLFTAHKAKGYMVERDYWETQTDEATKRCKALERAIIWNGIYCNLCINKYKSCTQLNSCTGFEFDQSRFSGDAP